MRKKTNQAKGEGPKVTGTPAQSRRLSRNDEITLADRFQLRKHMFRSMIGCVSIKKKTGRSSGPQGQKTRLVCSEFIPKNSS